MNVGRPTTIHGSRQTGTTTRADAGGTGPHQASSASTSQRRVAAPPSTSRNSRRIDATAAGTVSMSVTHTGMPRARIRRTSSSRFSSLFATTRSGRSAATADEVGVLGAPHPGDPAGVEVGGVGAPVGRPDEPLGAGRGQRLGERRHERDHPRDGSGQLDGVPEVVGEGARHPGGTGQRGAIRRAPSIRIVSPLR